MGTFQSGDNPLDFSQEFEGVDRLAIIRRSKLDPAPVAEITQLRTYPGVIEAGSDGMGLVNLPCPILEEIAFAPVEHADFTAKNRRRMVSAIQAQPCRLHPNHLNPPIL